MHEHTMKVAAMTAVRKTEIQLRPVPEISPDEVLLKMAYVGICGSDAHYYATGVRKGVTFHLPFILGHEASGVVIKAGSRVTNLKIGDRVCLEPQKTCGKCIFCKSGHYNMCPHVSFPSVPTQEDGMLREFFAFPADLCHKLPDNVSLEEGALIEPLAVGLSATERGNVSLGQTVVILGMGTIGLVTLLSAKARGASNVIAIDLFDNRLALAKQFGADYVINGKGDPVAEVMRITGGMGADVVFETAGSAFTAAQTVSYIKNCGKIVLVGNINGKTPMDFLDLMYREGSISTIFRYVNHFPIAINAVASGVINVKRLISAVYPFSETGKAFDRAIDDKANVIKVLIRIAD